MVRMISFFLAIGISLSWCSGSGVDHRFSELKLYPLPGSFITAEGNTIEFRFVKSPVEFIQAKDVFVRSFIKAYEEVDDLSDARIRAINNAFQEEIDEFIGPNDQMPFIALGAFCKEKLIGYVSFDRPTASGCVYIRELVVDFYYWRQGIGKSLVYTSFSLFGNVQSLVLVTRRTNTVARNFYTKLGFTEDETYVHAPWDPALFIGYVLIVSEDQK